jgi:hypothetical protein
MRLFGDTPMNGGSLGEASLLHTSLADCKVTFAKDSFGTLLTKWYSYCLVNVKTSPTLTNIDLTKLAPMPTVDRGGMTFGRCNRHTDVFLTGPSRQSPVPSSISPPQTGFHFSVVSCSRPPQTTLAFYRQLYTVPISQKRLSFPGQPAPRKRTVYVWGDCVG